MKPHLNRMLSIPTLIRCYYCGQQHNLIQLQRQIDGKNYYYTVCQQCEQQGQQVIAQFTQSPQCGGVAPT